MPSSLRGETSNHLSAAKLIASGRVGSVAAVPEPFEHFVITRFGVRWSEDQPPPDEAWLRYRLALFAAVTLPSMESQTAASRRWLLLIDHACRAGWLEDELALFGDGDVFETVWIDGLFWSTIGQVVTERATAPHVITTRLDSDDAIARDYLARIQATFAGQDALYVNFQRGLQFERSGALYTYLHASNAFLSFIERRRDGEPVRTVFSSTAHADAAKYADVLQVSAPPVWLQVVHGSNIMNEVHEIAWQVRPSALGDRFDVDLPLATVTTRALLVSRARTIWHRTLRVFRSRRMGKQILLTLVRGNRIQRQQNR